ncbi:HK97 gp10 family phage protein [Leuconostoc lactis]|uniref:HK97 gp10 family phage protein n=2 Tax=Leuconostoc TaxID=1243 RepID=UPI00241F591A|nr:HK97 gp10 family phage protein [Leuconostoc lactis]
MGSFGKFDTKDFDAFVSEFENKIQGEAIVTEIESALTQTAGTALNKIKKKTPVDKGTLRRNWQASNAKHFGGVFLIDIYNNTEYAPFIENGHRIVRGGRTVGYNSGVFMLRDAIKEVDDNWDKLVGKRFLKAVENILGG